MQELLLLLIFNTVYVCVSVLCRFIMCVTFKMMLFLPVQKKKKTKPNEGLVRGWHDIYCMFIYKYICIYACMYGIYIHVCKCVYVHLLTLVCIFIQRFSYALYAEVYYIFQEFCIEKLASLLICDFSLIWFCRILCACAFVWVNCNEFECATKFTLYLLSFVLLCSEIIFFNVSL